MLQFSFCDIKLVKARFVVHSSAHVEVPLERWKDLHKENTEIVTLAWSWEWVWQDMRASCVCSTRAEHAVSRLSSPRLA